MLDIITPDQIERFHEKIDKRAGLDDCWPWIAGCSNDGYGSFHIGPRSRDTRRVVKAHRLAWALHHNRDIPGAWVSGSPCVVRHSCDNPLCCNPHHLLLGDKAENSRDMVRRGRQRTPRGDANGSRTHPERVARGENNGRAKLSDEDVQEIFVLRHTHKLTHKLIAIIMGCGQTQVRKILRGVSRTKSEPVTSGQEAYRARMAQGVADA